MKGDEWEINIHFNMSGEETPIELEDPTSFLIQISDIFPNKSQFSEEWQDPHEVK